MHTAAINRFPLLGRPRPPCPAVPERVREIADIAHSATQAGTDGPVRAKNALTMAALIASDCGMPDLARDLCWQHINTYLSTDRQLGATEARHMLESVLNLARLQLRANNGSQAVELLAAMYQAVRMGTDLVVEQRTLPLADVTGTDNEHRTLREWIWLTYLSEGIRALALAHRWNDAATHAQRLRGVGAHLMEGRQAVILAHHVNGNPDAARAALAEATPQHPWEHQVAACLTVLCGNPNQDAASTDVATMIQNFTEHPPVPGYAAYRAQLGLTVSTLARTTDPDAAQHVLNQTANETIQTGDGYAARDLLREHHKAPSLTTEQHDAVTNLVTSSGLGVGTMPGPLLRALTRSAQIAVEVLSAPTQRSVPATSSPRETTRVPHATAVPAGLLEEVRTIHRRDLSLLDHDLPSLRLRPLTGGRNNRVFAWESPEGEVCLKLYRTDKRDRAACEYQALAHIAACGVTAAPQPLWHEPDPELPAVAMTMVAGQPVPDLADPTTALRAIVAVLGQLREIPLGPFADTPRVDSAIHYMKRITDVWPAQLDDHGDDPLTADLRSLLDAWHERGDAAVLAEPAPQIFSRGDSNLLNWLWDGSNARVVDWEFAGYSDTAYDAADLVEHLSAHTINDDCWISVLPDLGITDDTTRRRFLAARRTVALRWLSVLWKRRHNRADDFEFQLKRTHHLMTNDTS